MKNPKYAKWITCLGMSGFLAIAARADVEITASGSYKGSIQSDQGKRFNQISYVVRVPQGKHVHISIVGSPTISQTTGSWSNTASFNSAGSYRTHVFDANLNRMTTYDSFSETRIDMASKCSPEELPWPLIGYYDAFYAKLDFEISVTYEDVCPDLEVASIAAKSDFVIEGDKLVFEVVVKNRGYASAAASKVTVADNGNKVGTYDVAALSAGASALRSFETAALTEGEHVFSFTVDKVAEEKVTSNNSGTRTIVVNGHSSYKVYFDANGGSGRMDPENFVQGVPQKLPRNLFTREWFRFKGWSRSRYYGSVDFRDEEMLERLNIGEAGGVTLFAVWEEVERVTVKFLLNGADTRTERETVQSAWLEMEGPLQTLAEFVGTLISECDRFSSKELRISEAKTLARKVLEDYSTGRESYSIPTSESYWAWHLPAQDFIRYGICGWGASRYDWDYTLVREAFDEYNGDATRMMNLTATLVTKIDEIRKLNKEIDAKDFLFELETEKWGHMADIPNPGLFEGITFAGWWTEPDGGTHVTSSSVFAENMILYAHWIDGDVGMERPVVRLNIVNNAVAVEWDGIDGATVYEVFRREGVLSPNEGRRKPEWIATVKELGRQDKEIKGGRSYSYFVRAIAADGRESESEVVTVALSSDPHWAVNGYTVRFCSDGGTRLVSLLQMECGRVHNLPLGMLQSPLGKRFAGWACSNGRRYDDGMLVFNLAQPGGEVTMTAVWEMADYSDGVQLWENGPYWAECNVGATNPVECGYYFMWGDTVGYKRNARNDGWISVKDSTGFSFDSGNCPTYGKSNSQLQSEGYIDSTSNLVAKYDAATAHLGAPWRMPTSAEIDALISNCDVEWTMWNGVYGRLVKGRGTYASKSMFLPAAGYGDDAGLRNLRSRGYYWSSTPYSNYSGSAWYLDFDTSDLHQSYHYRFFGWSVRPVRGFAK